MPRWVVRAIAAAFILAALASAVLVFVAIRDLSLSWSGPGFGSLGSFGQAPEEGTQVPGTPPPGGSAMEQLPEPWSGTERVTILFMGLDYRDWLEGDGPPRTDTMILATIDPLTETAGLLSIPRDLWVEIPGFGHNRINTAYFLGETNQLPGGGPALAMETVENLLGVQIQYYAVVEFSAFERMIDEIGGIELLVPERIKIAPIGRTAKWLEPKGYVLDGAETLAYARVRSTEGGDFDRAQRQQQVAMAIREQILEFDMIPTLVARAPALYEELSSGIRTNLSLRDMIGLGLLAVRIPPEQIHRGVIGPPDMVRLEKLPTGEEVLTPVLDQIRILRDEIFTLNSGIGPSAKEKDPLEAALEEGARMAVLNGAGEEGLAARFAEALTSLGLDVTEVGNADRLDYPTTRIIDYRGKPYTTKYLVETMGLTQSQVLFQSGADDEIDLALVLGYDWVEILPRLQAELE